MSNLIKDAFNSINASEELKTKTKTFLYDVIENNSLVIEKNDSCTAQNSDKNQANPPKRIFLNKKISLLVASLFSVLLLVGGIGFYFSPVSLISVDINPSIELGINRFNKVISVKGFNDDGSILASNANIKYMSYLEAIEEILETTTIRKLLSEGGTVYITIASKSENDAVIITSTLSNVPGNMTNEVLFYKANNQDISVAHKAGMSFGKYRMYAELKDLDNTVTPEIVHDMSMRQMKDKIDEKKQENLHGRGKGRKN